MGAKRQATISRPDLYEMLEPVRILQAEVNRLQAQVDTATVAMKSKASPINRLRRTYAITQSDLSESSGLSQSRISRIESGEASVTVAQADSLTAALKSQAAEGIPAGRAPNLSNLREEIVRTHGNDEAVASLEDITFAVDGYERDMSNGLGPATRIEGKR